MVVVGRDAVAAKSVQALGTWKSLTVRRGFKVHILALLHMMRSINNVEVNSLKFRFKTRVALAVAVASQQVHERVRTLDSGWRRFNGDMMASVLTGRR
jgi:hypothetical protein